MPSAKLSWRRRKYLINKGFQVPFILRFVLMALLVILTVFIANKYFFWSFAEKGRSIGLNEEDVFFQFLKEEENVMNRIFLAVSSFAFLFLFLSGLIISHRIAGPLYRLNKHMLDIAEGKTFSDVKFREKDQFVELADSFNKQLNFWKSRN